MSVRARVRALSGPRRLAVELALTAVVLITLLLVHYWPAVVRVLVLFFAWPAGQVWGNIIAAPIVGITVWGWGHRDRVRLHRKVDAQRAEIAALKEQQAVHHSLIRRHLGLRDA